MDSTFKNAIENASQPVGKEVNIINSREFEPLLTKARQVISFYNEAMGLSAAVLDKTGLAVKTSKYEKQIQFCEICRKHFDSAGMPREGFEYPCQKIHNDAFTASRDANGPYIYSCALGFVYWTNPLYSKGRYAGALSAGQILSCKREEAVKKFSSLCNDRTAIRNFSNLLKDVPEKSPEEIQAMADILEVCAGEISEGSEDSAGMIRRMVWREAESKEQVEIPAKKRNSAAAGVPVATPGDSEHLLEKERLLFAAFRRGDNQTGGKILKELMDDIMTAIPFDFEIARFRAIELTVLLSRSAAGDDGDSLFEANNRYLGRIQESKTPEELIENLRLVAERLAGKIFSFQGVCHASVLRKAERYIWENYTRKISLREIAKAAGLSAPYFSTIFKEEMGENLSSYLNRLRVEKAANLLTVTGKSLNEIAGLCGFEDQSWFSKIFKSFTGVSPGKYRETGKGAPVFKNTGKKQEEEIT